jgi:hypothetical protein
LLPDFPVFSKGVCENISFSKDDYLVCEVREQQFMTANGLKKARTIQKVFEHKPAPKQIKLF